MAKFVVDSKELPIEKLEKISREGIRQIVMAGADADAARMKELTSEKRHVRTRDMIDSIGSGDYKEYLGGGSVGVYPQGDDRKGVRNATKMYVINYGRGGVRKKDSRMGDRFITRAEKQMEELVTQAMQAESDRIIAKGEEE